MYNCLQPPRLQLARLLCPSLSTGAYTNSCPLSQLWHPPILFSVSPFSSCPQSFPASTLNIHWKTNAEAEVPILWPLNWKRQLVGKDPHAGKDRRQKERGWQRVRWLDSITHSMDKNFSKLREIVKDREEWHAAATGLQRITHDSNWKPCCQNQNKKYIQRR